MLLRPRADRESRIDLPHSYDVMADPLSRRHPRSPTTTPATPQSRSSAAPQLQRPSHPTFPFYASGCLSLSLSLSLSLALSTSLSFSLLSLSLSRTLSLTAGPPTLELLTCTPISSTGCTSGPSSPPGNAAWIYPKRLFSRGAGWFGKAESSFHPRSTGQATPSTMLIEANVCFQRIRSPSEISERSAHVQETRTDARKIGM